MKFKEIILRGMLEMKTTKNEHSICLETIRMMLQAIAPFLNCITLEKSPCYEVILLKYYLLQYNHFESLELLLNNRRIIQIAPIIRCMLEILAQINFLSQPDSSEKAERVVLFDEYIKLTTGTPLEKCTDADLNRFTKLLKKNKLGESSSPRDPDSYYQDLLSSYKTNLTSEIKKVFENSERDGSCAAIIKNHYSFLSKLAHAGPVGLMEMIGHNKNDLFINQNNNRVCYFIYFAIIIMEKTHNILAKEIKHKKVNFPMEIQENMGTLAKVLGIN